MRYENIKDKELIELFSELPVNADYFANYLLEYRPIINILDKYCFEYCYVDQLYNIYVRAVKDIPYSSFLKLIKKGESQNFWGTFKANKYTVLYLKANSFLCYYRKKRSSLEKDRITTKMLIRTAMMFSLQAIKIERIDMEQGEIYRYIDLDKCVHYIALTTSDRFKSADIKITQFTTKFTLLDEVRESKDIIDFWVVSPTALQPITYNRFKDNLDSKLYWFNNKVIDISHYFNGLPIDQH